MTETAAAGPKMTVTATAGLNMTAPHTVGSKSMAFIYIFIYLQVLDLLTTLVGFRMGATEASPFIRVLMHFGPATGVVISKLFALALGGFCLYFKKHHLMRWITYWYGVLVVWNLTVILGAPWTRLT